LGTGEAAGAVTDSYEYDAWGNTVSTSSSTPNEFFYRGEQLDSDLGLYYLRARFYNPLTGRLLSQDPYAGDIFYPKTLHRYRYAGGNPVNFIDPSGMDPIEYESNSSEIAFNAEGGEAGVAREESCILYAGASLLAAAFPDPGLALTALEIVGGDCGAESSEAGEEEETICALCFAAGTPIHTDQGNVSVEALKVGDKVLASNRTTGKLEYEPISALTIPHHDKLLEIRVEGERDPLRPSTGHPFWVKRGYAQPAWMPTGQMQVNDRLLTIDGQWRRVTSITPVGHEETVYNFTVDKDHDYFVGETGFLVHNAGGCGCNYRKTFFKAFPNLIGQVWVHHAIPQAVLNNYPGLFTPGEINDLGNLRGIPNGVNNDLHLSKINRIWNQFYRDNPNATRDAIEQKAKDIDQECGSQFLLPI
jgi:RHS repeat-associated protein